MLFARSGLRGLAKKAAAATTAGAAKRPTKTVKSTVESNGSSSGATEKEELTDSAAAFAYRSSLLVSKASKVPSPAIAAVTAAAIGGVVSGSGGTSAFETAIAVARAGEEEEEKGKKLLLRKKSTKGTVAKSGNNEKLKTVDQDSEGDNSVTSDAAVVEVEESSNSEKQESRSKKATTTTTTTTKKKNDALKKTTTTTTAASAATKKKTSAATAISKSAAQQEEGFEEDTELTASRKKKEAILVLAEKGSAVVSIGNALGLASASAGRRTGYFEGQLMVVVPLRGHVLALTDPNPAKNKWSLKNLPAIPTEFRWQPIKIDGRGKTSAMKKTVISEDTHSAKKTTATTTTSDSTSSSGTELLLENVSRMFRMYNITKIINACDAGREGELIFYSVREYLSLLNIPVQRLWLQAMTPDSVRNAFAALLDESQKFSLLQAARCRAEADWLIGINTTRAASYRCNEKKPHNFKFETMRFGRVQSPTLALIVNRQRERDAFVSTNRWKVDVVFAVKDKKDAGNDQEHRPLITVESSKLNGGEEDGANAPAAAAVVKSESESDKPDAPPTTATPAPAPAPPTTIAEMHKHAQDSFFRSYQGTWFDPKKEKSDAFIESEEELQRIKNCMTIIKSIETKDQVTNSVKQPPSLFSLTSLQKYFGRTHSTTAANTLNAVQRLYAAHNIVSYPRSDSTALPTSMVPDIIKLFEDAKNLAIWDIPDEVRDMCVAKLKSSDPGPIFDDSKVTDHHAIIPTTLDYLPSQLVGLDRSVYRTIQLRLLQSLLPAAKFQVTTRIATVNGSEHFRSRYTQIVQPGWTVMDVRDSDDITRREMPTIGKDQTLQISRVVVNETPTTPPEYYTDATLLTAMERAGQSVSDLEHREAIKGRGLGTVATRTQIISELESSGAIVRRRSELIPTLSGIFRVKVLESLGLNHLVNADMTAEWEHKLYLIEQGKLSRDDFMKEIRELTMKSTGLFKEDETFSTPLDPTPLDADCPSCKKNGSVREHLFYFNCSDCSYILPRYRLGHPLSRSEVERLLKGEIVSLGVEMFPHEDRPVKLENQQIVGVTRALTDYPPLCRCPRCNKSDIRISKKLYVCDNCRFFIPKVFMDSVIDPPLALLLAQGQWSPRMPFRSLKTRRPFKAKLRIADSGQIEFSFDSKAKDDHSGEDK